MSRRTGGRFVSGVNVIPVEETEEMCQGTSVHVICISYGVVYGGTYMWLLQIRTCCVLTSLHCTFLRLTCLHVCNCLVQAGARHVSPKSFVASCRAQAASHHLLCNKHGPWHRLKEELVDGSRRVNQRRQLR